MTGFITGKELQELFSNAGCFVLPSSHEGLPIALLEALSFGLPCIVSDIPAHKGILHTTIHYFPVHSTKDLQELLHKAQGGNFSIDRSLGRTYAATNFNWDIIAGKTLDVYSGK